MTFAPGLLNTQHPRLSSSLDPRGRAQRHVIAAIALFSSALLACGETADTAGSAGNTTNGGSAANSAGSGGSAGAITNSGGSAGTATVVPADANEIEACRHYLTAACDRLVECDPFFAPFCDNRLDTCPSRLFAEGSLWTVEQAYSCAEEWKQLACEDVVRGAAPNCARDRGTREVGDTCFSDVQCSSGFCSARILGSSAMCGKCLEAAAPLGECSSAKPCPADQYCFQPDGGSAGTCRDRGAVPTLTPGAVGEECGYDGPRCADGLVCEIELVGDEDEEPRTGTCAVPPKVGLPCAPTFDRMGACAEGATCTNRPTGTCVAQPSVGQSCGFTMCDASSYCYLGSDPEMKSHTCYARGEAGSDCKRRGMLGREREVCLGDLECMCLDNACTSSKCALPRLKGESCNSSTEVCVQGFECISGSCQVMKERDLAGAIERACQ